MDIKNGMAAVEAILFAAGREVKVVELMAALEVSEEEIIVIIDKAIIANLINFLYSINFSFNSKIYIF